MFKGKKIVVVMPAFNAAKTIERTYREIIDQHIVDLIIVVDDASDDKTIAIARTLPNAKVYTHDKNRGYGANQKTCYKMALHEGADIVIMVHPDYQYTPKLIPAMAGMIVNHIYHCVLGSRIIGAGALRGGMPLWKYFINRILTETENFLLPARLSEYHTGYRAFSRELLQAIPFENNSDDFIFDNEMLVQILAFGYPIGEVSCPTHYFSEASNISFRKSVLYGLGIFRVIFEYHFSRLGIINSPKFHRKKKK
ncbi:MAG: glycosyltransferase family 2 protein [Candidatus Omnitrophica bacterium]|nr:glycosyltransferase family 2 protein [Candidatus Omnitrophota bacterium]MBU1869900.1 glycosyltransferase family 2 protein [Candidatus Omnitrophota bacterium]